MPSVLPTVRRRGRKRPQRGCPGVRRRESRVLRTPVTGLVSSSARGTVGPRDTSHSHGPGQVPIMTTQSLQSHSPLTENFPDDAPAGGTVEVRIVSMDAEVARHVADALRLLFAGGEQRSYPAFTSGRGTRLHLTLDPARAPAHSVPGRTSADRPSTGRIRARRAEVPGLVRGRPAVPERSSLHGLPFP